MKIKKNAFTLIELLAVIVILALIALIATPIILDVINDSKKSSTELSLKNYLRAVELAVSNESLKNPTVNLNVICRIDEKSNGKELDCGTGESIKLEYTGEGLISGIIVLEKGVVTRLLNGTLKGTNKDIEFEQGKIIYTPNVTKSTLVTGQTFNIKIKQLANPNTEDITHATEDSNIVSIEFYSRGLLPNGYTKEKLEKLSSVDVSLKQDSSIIAYIDNGKIYVYSDNLINFNKESNAMLNNMKGVINIKFNIIDTSEVTTVWGMFDFDNNLKYIDINAINTKNISNFSRMFRNCSSLTNLDVSSWDMSGATTMYQMFFGCSSLTELDLSKWNTSNVTSTQEMFRGCKDLTNLDLSKWNTSNLISMGAMFYGCKGLTTLDLSDWNTINLTSLAQIFYNCSSLTNLDLSGFNTKNVTDMSYMFYNCKSLKSIFVGENFQIPETATNMFYNCATESEEQLCKPNSSNSYCTLN